jgi:type II secretion system protein L
VSELRLYLQRDGLHDGQACPWVLLDRDGHIERSGASLDEAPRAALCRVVIEADRVGLVETDLPDLAERKLAPLLANAVEAATLDEPEQLHVVLAGRSPQGKACCATVSAAWLERLLGKLAEREIYPDAAVSEGWLLPVQPDVWSVVVNQGSSLLRLDAARALVVDAGDPPTGVQLALGRAYRPRRIQVYQGSSLQPPNLEAWRSALDIEVESRGKWDWRNAPWPATPNLLSGRLAARRAGMDLASVIRPLLWGGLALALIQVVGLGIDSLMLQRENTALLAEQRKLSQRVLPSQANVVEPAWQVSEMLARLRNAQGQGGEVAMLPLLARLGGIWPAAGAPSVRSVTYADGGLEIALTAKPAAWVAQLQADAAAANLEVATGDAGGALSIIKIRDLTPGGNRGR